MALQQHGAEEVWRTLSDAGVSHCFINPGTSELWLASALCHSDITPVLCLHEGVCAGAAEGFARVYSAPSSVLLHLSVGFSNAFANLHNASKARSPVIAIVGSMSTYFQGKGAVLDHPHPRPLAEHISASVSEPSSALTVRPSLRHLVNSIDASSNSAVSTSALSTRLATAIIPHNVQWQPISEADSQRIRQEQPVSFRMFMGQSSPHDASLPHDVLAFLAQCADALVQSSSIAFVLGGRALIANGTLEAVSRAADTIGAALLTEGSFARADRGLGRPCIQRLSYFPNDARKELDRFEKLVLVDARKPVAPFGYASEEGKDVLPLNDDDNDDRLWTLDSEDIKCVCEQLAHLLEQRTTSPISYASSTTRNSSTSERPPSLPTDNTLTPRNMCQCLAALQPECIVVDESLTSGTHYFELSHGCPPFMHLGLTGGAIGQGMPCALGAALADRSCKVISLQADGSALYTLQALWSQARERADVVTIITNNGSYQILVRTLRLINLFAFYNYCNKPVCTLLQRLELAMQGIPLSDGVSDNTTALQGLDFCSLARGLGATASRATTCSDFAQQLRDNLHQTLEGPHLIDAQLVTC
jgi:acetolactate synthase-1/2/3 large subunit